MNAVSTLLVAIVIYLGIGVAFAVIFVTHLIGRVDPVARGSSAWFRIIIMPGVAALWPWMLARSLRPHKAPHP